MWCFRALPAMNPSHLLAKSSRDPFHPQRRETLISHTVETARVALGICDRFGPAFAQSFGLGPKEVLPTLRAAASRGAFLHDLGKANHQFQRMLRVPNAPRQALRHELLSAWLPLHLPSLSDWIFDGQPEIVRYSSLFAVAGHHLKFGDGQDAAVRSGSCDSELKVFVDHPDFQATLDAGASLLGIGVAPSRLEKLILLLYDEPLKDLMDWLRPASRWWNSTGPTDRAIVAFVKAIVVSADVASSAISRRHEVPVDWTIEALARGCDPDQIGRVAEEHLHGQPARPFQQQVASTTTRTTLVIAGCGTGKTVAAYMWAARHAKGRKLFFCYPTTGTATQGFEDYVWPITDELDSRLVHSRARVDIEDIMGSQEESTTDPHLHSKFEALSTWDVPLSIGTADMVLGLLQNHPRCLFRFPSLALGAYVFDEVHNYDDRMFQTLLRFLSIFGGSQVLLMTASLPRSRRRALEETLRNLGECLTVIGGPVEFECHPRYLLHPSRTDPPWNEVRDGLARGEKVLWVANTVDRAVEIAKAAEEVEKLRPVLLYHSRFRYGDRREKHRAIIRAFKDPGGVLAVTTQVCEVSLDLSADLLVSDLAPTPSLIQRLGRLNRHTLPGSPTRPGHALFLETKSPQPYEQDDLEQASRWIAGLVGRPVSQKALTQAFEDGVTETFQGRLPKMEWPDGGPFSVPSQLREPGYTVPIVRGEDSSYCLREGGKIDGEGVVRMSIPMPLSSVAREISTWKRLGLSLVCPAGRMVYSPEWGGQWVK